MEVSRPGAARRSWMHFVLCGAFLVGGAFIGAAVTLMITPNHATPASQPGPVDIGFAQDMSQHHAQAVQMAQMALGRDDSSAAIQTFARQILVSQSEEQGTLRGWLTIWGAPQLPSGPAMTWMSSKHDMHSPANGLMPGMATPAQLVHLGRLTGPVFDREFLILMERHHLGGIEMSEFAAAHARRPQVRSLAANMASEQAKEVAAFRRLLREAHGQ